MSYVLEGNLKADELSVMCSSYLGCTIKRYETPAQTHYINVTLLEVTTVK